MVCILYTQIQWPRSICHEELAPTHSRQKQLRIEAALPSTPKGLLARVS